MTWTYTETTRTARNRVRERIGDIVSTVQLVCDEVIDEKLSDHSQSVILAAIDCVRLILAKIARDVDRSGAGLSGSRDQKTQHYKELLERLEAESGEGASGGAACSCYLSGVSVSERESMRDDDDFIEPSFDVGGDDRPGTSPEDVADEDDE